MVPDDTDCKNHTKPTAPIGEHSQKNNDHTRRDNQDASLTHSADVHPTHNADVYPTYKSRKIRTSPMTPLHSSSNALSSSTTPTTPYFSTHAAYPTEEKERQKIMKRARKKAAGKVEEKTL